MNETTEGNLYCPLRLLWKKIIAEIDVKAFFKLKTCFSVGGLLLFSSSSPIAETL